ncbi:MFS transporter [Actinospica durhamensis]|uniref:MFS transporter n=1 Tax=Actinospica durhamensis TaxID=1508375 RepID=A0A941IPG3_9ACTN|nr:MFS transporter [Actinospica durhamensis]MBR7836505.1 MFS transporter [Actinospica durhamensis]
MAQVEQQATAEPRSLWRERDFSLVWSGALISEMGDSVTSLALALTAVLLLHADAFQLGALRAASTAAFLLIALPAGVLVDRRRKRPVMLGADLGRMLLIGSIPVAAALGMLTLLQLYLVALAAGLLSVFFDVAYQSFVPVLVGRERLVEGNSKMGLPGSFANVIGPSAAGGLIALAGAARAMGADAGSFAVSATTLALLRTREPDPAPPAAKRRMAAEIAEGLRYVAGHRILRRIVACTATSNLFNGVWGSVLMLFLIDDLHAGASQIGLAFSLGSLGGLAGGFLAPWLARRLGSARMLWMSKAGLGWLLLAIPLARPGWGLLLVSLGQFVGSISAMTYNVAQVSYRQSVTPPHLLGRMNASVRWVIWGTIPVGALFGGWLGTVTSVRTTVLVGVLGSWLAVLWIVLSPLVKLREIPVPPADVPDGDPLP